MAMVQRHQNWGQTRRIVPPMPKRNLPILLIARDMQDPCGMAKIFAFYSYYRPVEKPVLRYRFWPGTKPDAQTGVSKSSWSKGEANVPVA